MRWSIDLNVLDPELTTPTVFWGFFESHGASEAALPKRKISEAKAGPHAGTVETEFYESWSLGSVHK